MLIDEGTSFNFDITGNGFSVVGSVLALFFIFISLFFAPWFHWQKQDRDANSSHIYQEISLVALLPRSEFVTSNISYLPIAEKDAQLAMQIAMLGRAVALVAFVLASRLISRTPGCVLLCFILGFMLCGCFFLTDAFNQEDIDFFRTLNSNEPIWYMTGLSWSGPLTLIIGVGVVGILAAIDSDKTLKEILLIGILFVLTISLCLRLSQTAVHLSAQVVPQIANERDQIDISSEITGTLAFVSERDGNPEIYLISDSNDSKLVNLTNNTANDFNPAWAPNGKRLAFISDRSGNFDIYVMNADGSEQMNLTNNSVNDFSPTWSPDGTRIAFVSGDHNGQEIIIMNVDLLSRSQLIDSTTRLLNPVWLSSDQQMVYEELGSSGQTAVKLVYRLSLDKLEQELLYYFIGDSYTYCPSWSEHGPKTLFTSNRTYNYEIYLLEETGGTSNLTDNPADDSCPAWSPDGKWIAFGSNRNGNQEIYLMSGDGSNVKQLTNDLKNDYDPVWQP